MVVVVAVLEVQVKMDVVTKPKQDLLVVAAQEVAVEAVITDILAMALLQILAVEAVAQNVVAMVVLAVRVLLFLNILTIKQLQLVLV
jgi:hypothetical protein